MHAPGTGSRRGWPLLMLVIGVAALASAGPRQVLAEGLAKRPVAAPAPVSVTGEAAVATEGVRVIVTDAEATAPTGRSGGGARAAQDQIVARYVPLGAVVEGTFEYLPAVVMTVLPETHARMLADSSIRVEIDTLAAPTLAASVPLVGGPAAWAGGFTGAGYAIAVLDTGVDGSHPMLAGKVVSEACYSTTSGAISTSLCPGGANESTAPGSGVNCSTGLGATCSHGTHVAAIAAGNGDLKGIAPDATIIAIQVFSRFTSPGLCGGPATCVLSYSSDQVRALERVYALRDAYTIAAVNMSLGGGQSKAICDASYTSMKGAIDLLRSAGIATVIATGNNGWRDAISTPACISTAVSVGSTTNATTGETVSSFSNVTSFTSVLAPGYWVTSAVAGGGTASWSGTSMATPHVAGAWALLRQAKPSATVSEILAAVQATGKPVADTRSGGTVTLPRLRVNAAIEALTGLHLPGPNPVPAVTSLSPAGVEAGAGAFTLTVGGANFTESSTVHWNGTPRPTTFVSPSQLIAAISAADVAAGGSRQVSVVTPAPGGGTSQGMAFAITTPHPVPEVAALYPASKPAGSGQFTLTVQGNGFVPGSTVRWNGAARSTSFLSSTALRAQIPAGAVSGAGEATVTVFTPAPGGGEAEEALTFTILPPPNPAPSLSTINPASRDADSGAFTLTVNGANFRPGSVVRWNGSDRATSYVSAAQLTATITGADIEAAGSAQVTVSTPAPGGGVSAAQTFTITVAPNPAPAITSVSAQAGTAGATGGNRTFVVRGSGFLPASTLQIGIVSRSVTYVSPSEIRFELTTAEVATPRILQIRVANPAPGGGLSASWWIWVR